MLNFRDDANTARYAGEDIKPAGRRATRAVRANPPPAALIAQGVDLAPAGFVVPRHNA